MFEHVGKQLKTIGIGNINCLLVAQRGMDQHTTGFKSGIQHVGVAIFTNMHIQQTLNDRLQTLFDVETHRDGPHHLTIFVSNRFVVTNKLFTEQCDHTGKGFIFQKQRQRRIIMP